MKMNSRTGEMKNEFVLVFFLFPLTLLRQWRSRCNAWSMTDASPKTLAAVQLCICWFCSSSVNASQHFFCFFTSVCVRLVLAHGFDGILLASARHTDIAILLYCCDGTLALHRRRWWWCVLSSVLEREIKTHSTSTKMYINVCMIFEMGFAGRRWQ